MSTNACGIRHKSSSTTVGHDVLSRNAIFSQLSGTNSVVQNNALLLLHDALASNRPDIRGLLTIRRYMWCYLDVLLVFLRLAIAFERALFLGLPMHRSLDRLLTFRGLEGSSDVFLC